MVYSLIFTYFCGNLEYFLEMSDRETRATTASKSVLTLEQVSKLLDDKLECFESSVCSTLKTELMLEFRTLLNEQNSKIEKLESTVCILQNSVNILKKQVDDQTEGTDNNEQYGRRLCLRIEGKDVVRNEKAQDVLAEIMNISDSVGLEIPEMVFDRAHRIGEPYTDENNIQKQSIIVRLTTFRHRTMLYYKRKEIKERYGLFVRLDLTKKRYNNLKKAREWAKNFETIDYVCADINCRLKARLVSGKDVYFKDTSDLKSTLGI